MRRRIKLGNQIYEIEILKIQDNLLKVIVNDKEFYFSLKENEEPQSLSKEEIEKIISFSKDSILKEKKKNLDLPDKVLKSPLAGQISEVFVKEGDCVKINQKLLTIISMKMENEILSEIEGKIKEIKVKKGQIVSKDDILILFE
jgi:biotin carboxyl carrier protein